jgi:hypothetical protein
MACEGLVATRAGHSRNIWHSVVPYLWNVRHRYNLTNLERLSLQGILVALPNPVAPLTG